MYSVSGESVVCYAAIVGPDCACKAPGVDLTLTSIKCSHILFQICFSTEGWPKPQPILVLCNSKITL